MKKGFCQWLWPTEKVWFSYPISFTVNVNTAVATHHSSINNPYPLCVESNTYPDKVILRNGDSGNNVSTMIVIGY